MDDTTTGSRSDEELATQACIGSRDAFADLVQRHHAAIRGYVARFLRDRDAVDDLAQEVFLGAHRTLGGYRPEIPFRHWLLGIARHQVIDHLRALERRRALERNKLRDAVIDWQIARAEIDDGRWADNDRRLQALQACLDKLPAAQAELITQHYRQAQRSAEIAQRLKKTDGSLRMTLMRIRQALRACMRKQLAVQE